MEQMVPMLDGMASNREFEATEGGHLLALLEEEADWQLDIYNAHKSGKGVDDLQEKIEALEYAVNCLRICKVLVEAGCTPLYPLNSALPPLNVEV